MIESTVDSTGVLTLTFNRPERRNAMTLEMFRDYYRRLADADADPAVRAVVVTGAGDWFCSGADPEALGALLDPANHHLLLRDFGFPAHLPATLDTPIIAAVNGGAAGLGFVHALYADVRFLAEEAKLATAFSRLGLIAEYGSAWLLPRLIGPANALDLLLSGRKIDAAEALRLGLAQRVLPRAEVLAAAQAYARELATRCSPASLRVIRRQVWSGLDSSLEDAATAAVELMGESLRGAHFREAVLAAAEGRPAEFS